VETSSASSEVRLRVGVIALNDSLNQPLLRALADTCDLQCVLSVAPRPSSARLRKLASRSGPRLVVKSARSRALRAIDRWVERQVARLLGTAPPALAQTEQVSLSYITDGRAAARLAEIQPDLLLLSGAPILPEELFTIPRFGTVNIHWGLSRRYRGNHTLFYPLCRREYDAIGVTLHRVDRGIDTGPVIAERQLVVDPAATLAMVFAKAAQSAAELVTEFIRMLEQGLWPDSQKSEPGVLIRDRDRRVWHYARYAVIRQVAGRRLPRGGGDSAKLGRRAAGRRSGWAVRTSLIKGDLAVRRRRADRPPGDV
jgi:methionyl-tRNA formyltransferase